MLGCILVVLRCFLTWMLVRFVNIIVRLGVFVLLLLLLPVMHRSGGALALLLGHHGALGTPRGLRKCRGELRPRRGEDQGAR